MRYELEVTFDTGRVIVRVCRTFRQLSMAIDAALGAPGFRRYVVRAA